jgi:hypothetical protein
VHSVDEVHDTLYKTINEAPVGFGGSWIDHDVPFHRSAKGSSSYVLVWKTPTAVHAVDDAHDTPCSW